MRSCGSVVVLGDIPATVSLYIDPRVQVARTALPQERRTIFLGTTERETL